MDEIVNKVAGSGLVSIDPEELYVPGERVLLDIQPQLFQGQVLREKDFRAFIAGHDWSAYSGKLVAVHCSSDAIVPTWAYMLVAAALEPFAGRVVFGDLEDLENMLFAAQVEALDVSVYKDARVVIKGCSGKTVPVNAYVMLTARLKPVVKSIMYGEPCSTVPIYKSKRAATGS
jgi:hypothetical protein